MRPAIIFMSFLISISATIAQEISDATTLKARTWVSSDGKFKVDATFVASSDGNVLIKTSKGEFLRVPLNQLSESDRQYAASASKLRVGSRAANRWNVQLDLPTILNRKLVDRAIRLPESGGKNRRPSGLAMDRRNARAVVSIVEMDDRGNDPISTQIYWCDFQTGKVFGPLAAPMPIVPLVISADGFQLLARDDPKRNDPARGAHVWRLHPDRLEKVHQWNPYATLSSDRSQSVQWGRFLDDGHVLTLNQTGVLAMWRVPSDKPMWHVTNGSYGPALSPNHRYLAVGGVNKVQILGARNRREVASLPVDDFQYPSFAFSSDGTKLVGVTTKQVRMWDFASGAQLAKIDGVFPGGGQVDFIGDRFVLIGNQLLVDLEKNMHVWEFENYPRTSQRNSAGNFMEYFSGRCWVIVHGQGTVDTSLVPVKMPDEATQKYANSLDPSKNMLLYPGASVQLDLQLSDAQQLRDQVTAGLTKQLADRGITVDNSAQVKLVASIKKSGERSLVVAEIPRGTPRGNIPRATLFENKVTLMFNDRPIWQRTLQVNRDQEISARPKHRRPTTLAGYHQPNADFFSAVDLPRYYGSWEPYWPKSKILMTGASQVQLAGLSEADRALIDSAGPTIPTSSRSILKPDPEKVATSSSPPKPLAFPGPDPAFERMRNGQMAIDRKNARAMLCYFRQEGNQLPLPSEMYLFDLRANRVTGPIKATEAVEPLSLSPDGKHVVARNIYHRDRKSETLYVLRMDGDRMSTVVAWRPYAALDDRSQEIIWAEWVDEEHVLTASKSGVITRWTVATQKPDYQIDLQRNSASYPALSPGGAYFAVAGTREVRVHQTKTGDLIGQFAIDYTHTETVTAFSPDGTRLALSAKTYLKVWDITTGKLLHEALANGQHSSNTHLSFLDNRFLVVRGGGTMVDTKKRVWVWNYQNLGRTFRVDGHWWGYVRQPRQRKLAIVPVAIPHKAAVEYADSKDIDDLLAVRPGSPLKVRVGDLSIAASFRTQIQQALIEKLTKDGIKIDPNAEVEIVASVENIGARDVRVINSPIDRVTGDGKMIKVAKYQMKLVYMYDGKAIWTSSRLDNPIAQAQNYINRGMSVNEAIKTAQSASSFARFFSSIQLPRYVGKPELATTIRQTEVTVDGIR